MQEQQVSSSLRTASPGTMATTKPRVPQTGKKRETPDTPQDREFPHLSDRPTPLLQNKDSRFQETSSGPSFQTQKRDANPLSNAECSPPDRFGGVKFCQEHNAGYQFPTFDGSNLPRTSTKSQTSGKPTDLRDFSPGSLLLEQTLYHHSFGNTSQTPKSPRAPRTTHTSSKCRMPSSNACVNRSRPLEHPSMNVGEQVRTLPRSRTCSQTKEKYRGQTASTQHKNQSMQTGAPPTGQNNQPSHRTIYMT